MNKHDYAFYVGLALWLAETAFFGWHEHATTVPEQMFDGISFFLIAYGGLGSILRTFAPKVTIKISRDQVTGSSIEQ